MDNPYAHNHTECMPRRAAAGSIDLGHAPLYFCHPTSHMPGQRIVFTTFGTHGDVLPMLGLSKQLTAMGHHPVLAASTLYAPLARQHGVEFMPVGPSAEQHQRDLKMDANELLKRAFHPMTGGKFIAEKLVMPYFEQTYEELSVACEAADLLVAPPSTPWAHLIAARLNLPWKALMLQPATVCMASAQDPVVMSAHLPIHQLSSWFGEQAYAAFLHSVKNLGRKRWLSHLDRKAKLLGIYHPQLHPLFDHVFAPSGTVALLPQVMLRDPLPTDIPSNISFAGFSYFDGGQDQMPADLLQFLEHGPQPITFSLGTSAVFNTRRFYEACSSACSKLGVRAVFLTKDTEFGRNLPASQIVAPWASHAALFPRSQAVVSQGGIGTCAQAARAGIPHLLVPHGHDQPDNAARLMRHGAALTLKPGRAKGVILEETLSRLIGDSTLRKNAHGFKSQINSICGTLTGAQMIVAPGLKSRSLRPLSPTSVQYCAHS